MAARARAVAEIVAIVGLVLLIVWIAKPLGRLDFDLSLRMLFVAWIVGSPWLHGDSRERLGLRMDTFRNALVRVLPISLAAAGL